MVYFLSSYSLTIGTLFEQVEFFFFVYGERNWFYLLDSCKENCHYECIGDRLVLTAITPITKDQGLTLNFIKPYNPKATRQGFLLSLLFYSQFSFLNFVALIKSQFQYTCACELCANDSVRDETRAFVCKKVFLLSHCFEEQITEMY